MNNAPVFDRALSIIQEKYSLWEKTGKGRRSWYFFPSQLVNCIKIVEANTVASTGAEGYFTFNGPDIKKNYYPIEGDKSYSSADDLTSALLLVHEITHVQQYIDSKTDKTSLS